jgi:4-diphosphocytidyl-2-C-methyl-D-erythritol kinase
MLSFPNIKINLGLRVTQKRSDGFHQLETVFFPVAWHDALEILPSRELNLHVTGNAIPGPPEQNLCIKAWHLLHRDYPQLEPVDIYLHKTIPAGAGLGGGSSNAAFMLKALNRLFQLGISTTQLEQYALELGSDCPFFIQNQPVFATGRGEIFSPVQCNLQGYHIVLVNPGIHVPTGWAFAQLTPRPAEPGWQQLLQQPVSQWQALGLINDFEAPVIEQYPIMQEVKTTLLEMGADYVAMSGSGSTFFGIFAQQPPSLQVFEAKGMIVKCVQL